MRSEKQKQHPEIKLMLELLQEKKLVSFSPTLQNQNVFVMKKCYFYLLQLTATQKQISFTFLTRCEQNKINKKNL